MASKSFLKSRCIAVVVFSVFLTGMASSPPLVGGPAPAFELKTVEGQVVKLEDMKGKFLILTFWATWCVPCIKEMPEFEKIYQSSPDKNIKIIAVNFSESKEKVENYIRGRNLNFPVALDRYGNISGKYKVRHLPVTFIITPDGIIQEELIGGGLTQEIIENKIGQYKGYL